LPAIISGVDPARKGTIIPFNGRIIILNDGDVCSILIVKIETFRSSKFSGAENNAMTKTTTHQKTNPMPDIADCRAVDIGIAQFAECLCNGPNSCIYALPFGYCFLCRHPRLAEIIENTKKIQQPGIN